MRSFLRYYCLFIIAAAIISCNQQQPKIPSLNETFAKNDKLPFGTYVAYNQMEYLYPHNTIFVKKQKFEDTWREISDTKALYISVSKNLFLTTADLTAMLQYVDAGNSIFISSNYIDQKLLDTLGCSTVAKDIEYFAPDLMDYTHVSLAAPLFKDSSDYSYFYYPFINRFLKYNTANTKILGFNQIGFPNFILLFHGKGKFFFHLEPKTFSNYFLLQKDNYKYLQNVFAYTTDNPEQIFWDDYYCRKNHVTDEGESRGMFSFITQYPPLRWAFWLTLLMLGVYIFFGGKRRQRIIEIVPPNSNTTVAFTETVGRLYLQNKNNRNIADKVIMYFFEQLRTQYFLNTSQINDEFITTLSRKSNMSLEATKKLFNTIQLIQNNYDVDDKQLLSLNQQIENFNKTKI